MKLLCSYHSKALLQLFEASVWHHGCTSFSSVAQAGSAERTLVAPWNSYWGLLMPQISFPAFSHESTQYRHISSHYTLSKYSALMMIYNKQKSHFLFTIFLLTIYSGIELCWERKPLEGCMCRLGTKYLKVWSCQAISVFLRGFVCRPGSESHVCLMQPYNLQNWCLKQGLITKKVCLCWGWWDWGFWTSPDEDICQTVYS